ncbi:MAG TPA: RNA methyltransferase [Myxococcaceae bacterium]|nr:RNA methyltransferase [Myxococcaceae bacterium]
MPGPEVVFASTSPGLEGALAEELAELGMVTPAGRGGVEVRGAAGLHQEVCLRSRIANGALLRLGTARGRDVPELAAELRKLPLDRVLPKGPRVPVEVEASGRHARVRDPKALAEQAWSVQVARGGMRPVGAARLVLRLSEDGCEVSADAAGDSLWKRGYRQEISRAPLRETLAAGILRIAGYRGKEPLWDPMCGSGTLPIEAALIALHRAPGRLRTFAFMSWRTFDEPAWHVRVGRARLDEKTDEPKIWATDLNAGSLGVARRNARRAGISGFLKIDRVDAREMQPPPKTPPGLVVANLPYGRRVGSEPELGPLFRDFGAALRRFAGWRVALLVSEGSPVDALGLDDARKVPLDNGGLPCTLLLGEIRRR